ncbi:MAG TPA: class I SAM-dependent methyltransferase, partial [Parvularculaceae bacterium]|nr:class I SAM-dependent methyltransferase [Parvularculaceae bacterium]
MAFAPFHLVAAGVGRLRRPGFDARAAVELTRFNLPFFPPTRYTLAASALLTVINDIIINKRQRVLELGSGFSTAYIAKALDETDGTLISVESNSAWLDHVRAYARCCGVADRLTAIHAPLSPRKGGLDWYDAEILHAELKGKEIDLLLVDGPVASSRAKRR